MKKTSLLVIIVIIVAGAFWAKGYYNDRYQVSDSFYTQVPVDEVNKDSWILNSKGEKAEKGKEYELIGYNKTGEEKIVDFSVKGTADKYYKPGTYIKVDVSKTISLGQSVVDKKDVPKGALDKIDQNGTKAK